MATSKIKLFFDEVISIPSRQTIFSRIPRIIYIRDFSTLASTSSTWYSPLLSAVRQRRQGDISQPALPVCNPTTIIFGITPPITASAAPASPSSPGGHGLVHFFMNRSHSSSHVHPPSKHGKSDWCENELAEKARERRLKDRLRKWERGEVAIQDLPSLALDEECEEIGNDSERPGSGIVVIGSPGTSSLPSLPPFFGHALSARAVANRGSSEPEGNSRFFRTSILVPRVRSLVQERACRVSRRREINELTIRMGVGMVGGTLSNREELVKTGVSDERQSKTEGQVAEDSLLLDEQKMWDDWGERIEVWPNVRQIADRAVGSVVATTITAASGKTEKREAIIVPWSAVHKAWVTQRSSRDLRKAWMKESSQKSVRDQQDEDDEEEDDDNEEHMDEVVERVKQDPDLDQHEQRLLSCIVDSGKTDRNSNLDSFDCWLKRRCQHHLVKSIYRHIPLTQCELLCPCLCYIPLHFNKASLKSMGCLDVFYSALQEPERH
jgi:hypothetical protein